MDELEPLEKELRNARLRTSETLDARVQALLSQADSEAPADQSRPLGRVLQKRIWRSVAVAAAAVLAVVGVTYMGGSAPMTLGDVKKALEAQKWMHVQVQQGDGGSWEMWVSFSPLRSGMRTSAGLVTFEDSQAQEKHVYDPEAKTITVTHRSDTPIDEVASPVQLIEQAIELMGEQGATLTRTKGEREGSPVEILDVTRGSVRAVLVCDRLTKLPIEIEGWTAGESGDFVRRMSARFDFPDTGPTSIYDLSVPRSAEVVVAYSVPGPSPLAIARHGDKYLEVQDVWVGPSGWVGVKFRTNVYMPFTIPSGYSEDPANQERWHADEFLLHNLLGGSRLLDDNGVRYLAYNGPAQSTYPDGSRGYSRYYHPLNDLVDVAKPREFTCRTIANIANVADRTREEDFRRYFEWRENPETWQLFELKFRASAPSTAPPAGFNEQDLAWWHKTNVREHGLRDWLLAMRRAGRNQEAYQRVLNESEETKLYLGYSWLDHLVHLGKKEEALKFYESYKEYAVQKWGDEAVKWGDLELCERAIDRLTQHNPNDPDRGTTPRQ